MGRNHSSDPPAIRLRDVSKQYDTDDDTIIAVDDVSLEVERGEVFGFLGPNGAGKSTTINMLLGLTEPTAGSTTVLGYDPQAAPVPIRQRIGVLPEGLGLYERLSGRRHLEFAIQWKDAVDDPDHLLARVSLDQEDAERPVSKYSKGMRQRLALAIALVNQPEVLVLDEPSAGLDPHGIRRLRRIIREERDRGATVFFSSHILDQVEAVCDRVAILADGELIDVDTVQGLRRTVGSGTELQLRVDDPVDVSVTNIDGVTSASQEGGILRIQTTESTAKAHVVERLVRSDVTVLDIDSETASLEDVFTAYTTSNGSLPADETAERRIEVVAL